MTALRHCNAPVTRGRALDEEDEERIQGGYRPRRGLRGGVKAWHDTLQTKHGTTQPSLLDDAARDGVLMGTMMRAA